MQRCPCGSGAGYDACCGPVHGGTPAATAETLMRSRFSGFALGHRSYLLTSWHPQTRPTALDLDADVRWRRLQIVDTDAGGPADAQGTVEFRATYVRAGRHAVLHERSRFSRVDGHWVYIDGEIIEPSPHPAPGSAARP